MRSTRSPFNDSASFHADVSLPQILERPVASVTRDVRRKKGTIQMNTIQNQAGFLLMKYNKEMKRTRRIE